MPFRRIKLVSIGLQGRLAFNFFNPIIIDRDEKSKCVACQFIHIKLEVKIIEVH